MIRENGIWDERSNTFIKASGTVEQGRRPMYRSHETQAAIDRLIARKLTESIRKGKQ